MDRVPALDTIPIFESPNKSASTPVKSFRGKENVLREMSINVQNNMITKSPPLKPAKKFRTSDNEILRVKRKIGNTAKMGVPVQTRNPATMAKRNARERRRVQNINHTLDNLERILPEHYLDKKDKNKKLSKLEILRCTIDYINSLQGVLTEDNQNNNLLLDAASFLPSYMFQTTAAHHSPLMDIIPSPPVHHLQASQQFQHQQQLSPLTPHQQQQQLTPDMMELQQMGPGVNFHSPTPATTCPSPLIENQQQWLMASMSASQAVPTTTSPLNNHQQMSFHEQQLQQLQPPAMTSLYHSPQSEQSYDAFWNVL